MAHPQTVIGVDNGVKGGLVALDARTGRILGKTAMPCLTRKGKPEVDVVEVDQWIKGFKKPHVVIEEPLKFAKSSQAVRSMALGFGKLLGLVLLRGWGHTCVEVKEWQDEMLGKGLPKGQTKPRARAVASVAAPHEQWLANERCRTPHDGMIDAFLIARYFLRQREL